MTQISKQRILLVGATGRTGRLLCDALAQRPGVHLRVMVRSLEQAGPFEDQGIEVVIGDVRDQATSWADNAVRDIDTIISALGGMPFQSNNLWRVDYEGTQRLIAAARTAGIGHYIYLSTMGLRRQRSLLNPLSILFYPKLLAEDALRRSGLEYTIIRPGGFVTGPGPVTGTRNTREQAAAACLAALERRDTRNKTWEIGAARLAEPGADPVLGVAVNPE